MKILMAKVIIGLFILMLLGMLIACIVMEPMLGMLGGGMCVVVWAAWVLTNDDLNGYR